MNFFKYSEYRDFISHIHKNYNVVPLKMLNSTNQIILRHDVDLDIYPAYKMALLENEIGVKSTFFILLNAQSYNPLSINNKNILREISSLGFEIGLHFDPTNYSKKY